MVSVWLSYLRSQGQNPGINMNGTDYISKLLAASNLSRLAVYGTTEPYLGAAVKQIESEFGAKVVSYCDGFRPAEHYVTLCAKSKPDIVLLGMGIQKEEQVAIQLKKIPGSHLIICGGAFLDFMGCGVKRAPLLMRRVFLEWLWRLLLEPIRLFSRYVLGNPLFLYRTLVIKISSTLLLLGDD